MKRVQAGKDEPPIECMAAETNASGLSGVKKRFRLRPAAIAACALLLVLLFGVAFHAVGMNMWRLFVSWDDDTMKMRIDAQGKITGRGYKNDLEPALDDAFFQKLEEMDMIPLLPSRLPDGLMLERVESKIETEYMRWATGIYTRDDGQFLISVVKRITERSGGNWSLQKDDRKLDMYERGGINFYIMDNLSMSRVFWIEPPYIIDIAGHVSREELRQMVDSMFERK